MGGRDVQSTGLTATAWFLMTTSFSPALGISASRTSRGLAFAAVMNAALLLMFASCVFCSIDFERRFLGVEKVEEMVVQQYDGSCMKD